MPANRVPARPGPPDGAERVWIALILVLAFALRLPGLNSGLWYDEIDTLVRYVRLPVGALITSYDSLNNHMFFSLQAGLATAIFGEAPWSLRLPAVLFGVASIWALWRLAREVAPPRVALLSALLMTVSYHHVWFSQNARGYTGILFFGLMATWLLIRGLRAPGWGAALGYGLCVALGLYTHLSSAFLFLAHGFAYLLWLALPGLRGGDRIPAGGVIKPLGGAVAGVLLALLLYAPVLGQMTGTFGTVQAGPQSQVAVASIAHWKNPLWMMTEIAASFGPVLAPLVPLAAIVLVAGAVAIGRRAPVLPLIVLLHLGTMTALLVALSFRIWPRYYLADIGFFCLFLIAGAFWLGDRLAPRLGLPSVGALLAWLGIAASLVLLPRNYLSPKQDFAGVQAYVEAVRAPDAPVMAVGLSAMPFTAYYAPGWTGVEDVAGFERAAGQSGQAWLVYTFPDVIERRHADLLAAAKERGFAKDRYFPGTLSGGGIVVLKSDGG